MLSLSARPNPSYSVIYAESGDLKVDSFALTPGTFTEVLGLGLAFTAFLAGILTMGTLL